MSASKTTDSSYNNNTSMASAVSKGLQWESGTIALDTSYPTDGEALTIFNNTKFVYLSNRGGYVFDYDLTNSLIIAYQTDNQATVASATVTPLLEVDDTTDLSALSDIPYFAVGWD